MIKKLFILQICSLFFSSSIYSMDCGQDVNQDVNNDSNVKFLIENQVVICPEKLCRLSVTISNILDDVEDYGKEESLPIPLANRTMSEWNMLRPLLEMVYERDVKAIKSKLQTYNMEELRSLLYVTRYLDVRKTSELEDDIVLEEMIAGEIGSRLSTKDNLCKYRESLEFLKDLVLMTEEISEYSSKMIGAQIMSQAREARRKLRQQCSVTGKVLKGHTGSVLSVSFNNAGDKIASGSSDCTVRIWDVESGKCEKVLTGHTGSVFSVSFNNAGDKIASGTLDRTIRIWDVKSGQCEKVLEGHTGFVNSVSFNNAGDKIVSGSHDRTVRIWDVESGQCEKVLEGHTGLVNSVSFNNAEDKIVSGSWDHTVRIWDVESGQCEVLTGHTDWVWSVSFNNAGDKIASGSQDRTIRIWDVESGQCEKVLEGHTGFVYSVSFNNAGDKIVLGSWDKTVRIWDVESGQCEVLTGHASVVSSVSFNKAGDKIASGSLDRTIRIWDLSEINTCENYLQNNVTIEQALLILCWNEAMEKGKNFNIIADYQHLVPIVESIDNKVIRNIILPRSFISRGICAVIDWGWSFFKKDK